jgi:hypothetical protein
MRENRLVAALAAVLTLLLASPEVMAGAPALQVFPGIQSDPLGRELQSAMIWAGTQSEKDGVAVTFRKTFQLGQSAIAANISVFADARYILWVNGQYVERGPARFQPNGSEYDTIEISPFLHAGKNVLALLVVGNLSGGKVMRHSPGLGLIVESDLREVLRTDNSWKCSFSNPYQKVQASWPNLMDEQVDARVGGGDWTALDYNDGQWQRAVGIDGKAWGPLTARRIPRLRETPVPLQISDGVTLPVTLTNGQRLTFETSRLVQAYPLLSFTADADTELQIEPYGVEYTARAGQQTYFTLDSMGTTKVEIVLQRGRATINNFKLIERLYPYDRVGAFSSEDPFLNQLWEMCARSCEVLSEDSYVDCADRERVEWMDDSPPGFDITRTVMAGPSLTKGATVFSDPRLLEELVRRTGLTLQPEGWVKAHTCSDRYDIHAKMEDRACDWVEGLRTYYEATRDPKVIREIWPAVSAQMNYFLDRRSPRGLVRARDWVVWGNPLGYITGETTTLNVFVQRALVDSAFLATSIGENGDAKKFSRAAQNLAQAINSILWDQSRGVYFSGYFDAADSTNLNQTISGARKVPLPVTNHRTPATLHAEVFALDQGVVPPERRERVLAEVVKRGGDKPSESIMIYYYLIKQLYARDRPELDTQVLALFRQGWEAMVANPWECSWESFGGGSKAHIYGMYPGYFLSAYVLGVRRDAAVWQHEILIEPHLGDLSRATGVVVTEFGPVPVWWQKADGRLRFKFTIPAGADATLSLPYQPGDREIHLNGIMRDGEALANRLVVKLQSGDYSGEY